MAIPDDILQSIEKVKEVVSKALPRLVASQKQDIILAKGALNGRAPWQELKPSTVKRKKGKSDIWIDSGDTYDSFSDESFSSEGDTDTLASSVPDYAHYVDEGTSKMVARPLLNFTSGDVKQLTQELSDQIAKELGSG